MIKKVLFLFVFLFIGLGSLNANAANNNIQRIDKFYEVTNTDEWKKLSKKDRFEKVNLPSDFVSMLSDSELVHALIKFPFTVDLKVLDNLNEIPTYLLNESNVYKELFFNRNWINALNKYILDIKVSEENMLERDSTLAALISKKSLVRNLNSLERINYKKLVTDFNNIVKEKSDTSLIKNFELYNYTVTVKTPRGSRVNVTYITDEFSNSLKRSMDNEIERAYPWANRLRSASKKYNCHSYAWYSQSNTDGYWMNDPSKYWMDGSYEQYSGVVKKGIKVYYYKSGNEHSGIVSYVGSGIRNLKITSKWGSYGLYEHQIDDSPYGNYYRFYNRS